MWVSLLPDVGFIRGVRGMALAIFFQNLLRIRKASDVTLAKSAANNGYKQIPSNNTFYSVD